MTRYPISIARGQKAVLATMHGKERVITPIINSCLHLHVETCVGLDTDKFGTFSRDIQRVGTSLEAARKKAKTAAELSPMARVAIASEGSFGPSPYLPFVPIGREIVLLLDIETGFEIVGTDASLECNFSHITTTKIEDVIRFATAQLFPTHGLIVSGYQDNLPAPSLWLDKKIETMAELVSSFNQAINLSGMALIETDMRAHRNPTRMAAIGRATQDLVRRYYSLCPKCQHRGFDVVERIPGLPCEWCGLPTQVIMAEALVCQSCGYRHDRSVGTASTADPGRCQACNP